MSLERRASFEREALVHLDALYRVALAFTGDASDASDLVQETMRRAYRAWDQHETGTNAKVWLLTILRNAFINESPRRASRHEPTDGDFDELPIAHQEVFVLTGVEGLRYQESAQILSVPVATIKSRLFQARKLLQARLGRLARAEQ